MCPQPTRTESAVLFEGLWCMLSRLQHTAAANERAIRIGLFVLCMGVLWLTVAPSIHTSDSPELVSAAVTLGIPHAPGYALYVMVAHLATLLPVGEPAFRVNLLSVLLLSATAPVLFRLLVGLFASQTLAFGVTLTFMWSFYVWSVGVVAEVYALQTLTLSACLLSLFRLYQTAAPSRGQAISLGLLLGVAVAAHPAAVLFVPGIIVVFLHKKVPFLVCVQAAGASLLIWLLTLVYFPIRYAANPVLNSVGWYTESCEFMPVNLQTVSGIWWLVTGRQFDSLFFAQGILPSLEQLRTFGGWFWGNTLGFGTVVGVIGLVKLLKEQQMLLFLWGLLIVPYTYFFITYGADDRALMFTPTYLLWSLPLTAGFVTLGSVFTANVARWLPVGLALLLLIVNFPRVSLSSETHYLDTSYAILDDIPEDAAVFGDWHEIVALEFLQTIHGQRTDLTHFNLFLFQSNEAALTSCMEHLLTANKPIVYVILINHYLVYKNSYNFSKIQSYQSYNNVIEVYLVTPAN